MAPASVFSAPIQGEVQFHNANFVEQHTTLSPFLTYKDIFLLIEVVRVDQEQCELDQTDIISISQMFALKCLQDIHNIVVDGKVIMFNTSDISYEVECNRLRVTIQLSESLNSEELGDFTDEISDFIDEWDNFKTGTKEIMFDTSTMLVGH
tara:strand:- start:793 stop:1245 length:453 start_codon:yes stop_codon:yes gene_type:complete